MTKKFLRGFLPTFGLLAILILSISIGNIERRLGGKNSTTEQIGKEKRSTQISAPGSAGLDFNYQMLETTYQWEDISTTGTALSLSDDDYSSQGLSFAFPFYGGTYSEIHISSNGYISLEDHTPTSLSSYDFPSDSSNCYMMIAPMWDDLNPSSGGTVYFQNFTTHCIVQWDNIDHFGGTLQGTFQAVLYEDGNIEFRYQAIDYVSGYTIGLNHGHDLSLYNQYEGLVVPTSSFALLFEKTENLGVKNAQPAHNELVDPNGGANLSALVLDEDSSSIDAYFYDASDDTLIGSETSVPNNTRASTIWSGLQKGTEYAWYIIVQDGENSSRSVDRIFYTLGDVTLEYSSHQINEADGNGNGLAQPGEDIGLYLTLENVNTSTGTDIEVVLSAQSIYLSFWTNTQIYPDMSAGSTATNVNSFYLSISSAITPGTYTINASITSNQGSWNETFDIQVHSYDPAPPTLVSPIDYSNTIDTDVVLEVLVTDPNDDYLDVSFYDYSNDQLIGTVSNVENASVASVTWSDLTPVSWYFWYATCSDGTTIQRSLPSSWQFYIDQDQDGDGLYDSQENSIGTDPEDPDSDDDGMPDGWEYDYFLDPTADDATQDPDSDGLTNLGEYIHGTSPWNADTDDDLLSDGDEVNSYNTNPTETDSDGDGLSDYEEVITYPTDPTLFDTDDDGLNDSYEVHSSPTDPLNPDTDGDGMKDGWEVDNGLDPMTDDSNLDSDSDNVLNIYEYGNGTNPFSNDTDGDNLYDYDEIEVHGTDPTLKDTDGDGLDDDKEINDHETDPNDPDSDGDGMPDGWEITYGFNPNSGDDAGLDFDEDGLNNLGEFQNGTLPKNNDTDGDGYGDGEEVNAGTDPLNENEYPGSDDTPSSEEDEDSGDSGSNGVPGFSLGTLFLATLVAVGSLVTGFKRKRKHT